MERLKSISSAIFSTFERILFFLGLATDVIAITHSDTKTEDGAGNPILNPGMTEEGLQKVRDLMPALGKLLAGRKPATIQSAVGRRHRQVTGIVADFLNWPVEKIFHSGLWGDAETFKGRSKEKIILGHGEVIKWSQYLTSMHLGPQARRIVRKLDHLTIICTGRPLFVRLGMAPEECFSGALYVITVYFHLFIRIKHITGGVKLISAEKT